MQQRKSKKILIYFFLLLIIGSINNLSINEIKISNITDIKILGLGTENNNFLLEKINNLKLENIILIKKNELDNIISSNS